MSTVLFCAPHRPHTHNTSRFHSKSVCSNRIKLLCSANQPQPRRRHFVNLTNGLEAAEQLTTLVGLDNIRMTRIQSSHCEAGSYDKILHSLGPELLWSLATGYECVVYDYGSRDTTRGVPRALFLGL